MGDYTEHLITQAGGNGEPTEFSAGASVLYWPGIRSANIPGRPGKVISDGIVKFCGTDCVRIETLECGTDYIALTHIEKMP